MGELGTSSETYQRLIKDLSETHWRLIGNLSELFVNGCPKSMLYACFGGLNTISAFPHLFEEIWAMIRSLIRYFVSILDEK